MSRGFKGFAQKNLQLTEHNALRDSSHSWNQKLEHHKERRTLRSSHNVRVQRIHPLHSDLLQGNARSNILEKFHDAEPSNDLPLTRMALKLQPLSLDDYGE